MPQLDLTLNLNESKIFAQKIISNCSNIPFFSLYDGASNLFATSNSNDEKLPYQIHCFSMEHKDKPSTFSLVVLLHLTFKDLLDKSHKSIHFTIQRSFDKPLVSSDQKVLHEHAKRVQDEVMNHVNFGLINSFLNNNICSWEVIERMLFLEVNYPSTTSGKDINKYLLNPFTAYFRLWNISRLTIFKDVLHKFNDLNMGIDTSFIKFDEQEPTKLYALLPFSTEQFEDKRKKEHEFIKSSLQALTFNVNFAVSEQSALATNEIINYIRVNELLCELEHVESERDQLISNMIFQNFNFQDAKRIVESSDNSVYSEAALKNLDHLEQMYQRLVQAVRDCSFIN